MKEYIIGIDLGTTNSVVAILENGEPRVIPTAEGSPLCPSVVGFTPSHEILVGELARRQLITHPDRTFSSFKRAMGTDTKYCVDDKEYSPQELSAMVLHKLKDDAEAYLRKPVEKVVITIPAYFSDAQRQATKDAGRIAGLDVLRIVNEPTAAALAYGIDNRTAQNVLVWDLGGGTFDVSVLSMENGMFQVIATSGDNMLGGNDWDMRIVDHALMQLTPQVQALVRADLVAVNRLKESAEMAKRRLTTHTIAKISLPFLCTVDGEPVHLEARITREEFEQATADFRQRMSDPTGQVIYDARTKLDNLNTVLLVGGATRMPAIQELAWEMLKRDPVSGVNPDEAVALGAAIQAGIISGDLDDILLLDTTPLSLGVEEANGSFRCVIPRNTTIPTSVTKSFTTSRDYQEAVEIHIRQGERDIAAENRSLGRFHLTGLPRRLRGDLEIEVTFDIDENGIVHVSATEQSSGKRRQVVIRTQGGLTEEEIESMILSAEKFAQMDAMRLEITQLREDAQKLLDELSAGIPHQPKGSVSASDSARIDRGVMRVWQALAKGEATELRASFVALYDLATTVLLPGTVSRNYVSLKQMGKGSGGKEEVILELPDSSMIGA